MKRCNQQVQSSNTRGELQYAVESEFVKFNDCGRSEYRLMLDPA